MAVLNIHQRTLPAPVTEVGALIDGLSGPADRLWPSDRWPAMRLDRPLGPGAVGGHGPIRYTVVAHAPGQWVRFTFTGPKGVLGFHDYAVLPTGAGTVLRHTIAIRLRGWARLSWPLVFRWLHDALLEDCLDRAEQAVAGQVSRPARWNRRVRFLRRVIAALGPIRDRPAAVAVPGQEPERSS